LDDKNIELDAILYEYLNKYNIAVDDADKKHYKTLIVTQMMPIVQRIAKTIARRAYDPIEDLIQAGFIGVLKAIDYYKINLNDNFRVYAGYLIIGEMKHFLRDKVSAIRVPAHLQELSKRINNFIASLTSDDLVKLTNADVAIALQVTTKKVNLAMMAEQRKNIISLEDVYSNSDGCNYEERMSSEDYRERELFADAKIVMNEIIKKLPLKQRMLIDLFYNQGLSKQEIAEKIGCTPMTVCRDIRTIIDKLCSDYEGRTHSFSYEEFIE